METQATQSFTSYILSLVIYLSFLPTVEAVTSQAFVWDPVNGVNLLGRLPGQTNSYGMAISDNGRVAGLGDSGSATAFYWESGGGMQTISGLNHVSAVNDNGLVVGNTVAEIDCCVFSAAVWDPGTGLKLLGNFDGDGASSKGYEINNNDQVTGTASGFSHASNVMIWSEVNGYTSFGLDGTFGGARGINDAGKIVGHTRFSGSVHFEAFVGDAINGLTNLGALTGFSESIAWDINNLGRVALTAGNSFSAGNDVFLWDLSSGMQSLGITASAILDMNDAGQILGRDSSCFLGDCSGTFLWDSVHGYQLLTSDYLGLNLNENESFEIQGLNNNGQLVGTLHATPIPATTWLFGSGLIGLIGVARRKQS